jgi:hypothetical protein
MNTHKGVWLGNYLTSADLRVFPFDTVFIPDGNHHLYKQTKYIKSITQHIVSIRYSDWKERIDNYDAKWYYVDEPYRNGLDGIKSKTWVEAQIRARRDYIAYKRPNSRMVIGDIREILKKDYEPIPDVMYVYTSYISTWFFFNIPIAFGRPNQSGSIKRLAKIVGKQNIPWIWVFGKNKFFCHPDEFEQLNNTANELGISTQVLYLNNGTEVQEKHFSLDTMVSVIHAFLEERNEYNVFSWTWRFIKSLGYLIEWLIERIKEWVLK